MPEIKRATKHSASTVAKYISGIQVLPEYAEILRVKQGGSKERARIHWEKARLAARDMLGELSQRDRLLLMTGLYWGEGSKGAFDFINGDPYLVRAYIDGLFALGVKKEEIRLNFRIFSDMDKSVITKFWVGFLKFDESQVGWFEVVEGNGKRKLLHGMCRVHVIKGAPYFKLIMSMIDFIKSQSRCRSSMD